MYRQVIQWAHKKWKSVLNVKKHMEEGLAAILLNVLYTFLVAWPLDSDVPASAQTPKGTESGGAEDDGTTGCVAGTVA